MTRRRSLRCHAALLRPAVSTAVALGSLCGAYFYILYYNSNTSLLPVLATALGALVLTAGCSALNQVQEAARDALMERTRTRPLPAGRMTRRAALLLGALLAAAGLGCFALGGGWVLAGTGLAVVALYNGLYTPLKPRTPLALLLGAVAGALPPLTGWLAAGGRVLDPPIVIVTLVFYLWQVPHFWLLAENRRQEYVRAGFALPGRGLPPWLVRALRDLWVGAYFTGLAVLAVATADAPWPVLMAVPATLALVVAAIRTGRTRLASTLVDISLPLALLGIIIR